MLGKRVVFLLIFVSSFLLCTVAGLAFNPLNDVQTAAPADTNHIVLPVFYADAAWGTTLSIRNPDDRQSIVAFVVMKSAQEGIPLLCFFIYLSPKDSWTGTITDPGVFSSSDDSMLATADPVFADQSPIELSLDRFDTLEIPVNSGYVEVVEVASFDLGANPSKVAIKAAFDQQSQLSCVVLFDCGGDSLDTCPNSGALEAEATIANSQTGEAHHYRSNEEASTPSGQVQGKVTDAVTGEPVQGASLLLEPGTITLASQAEGAFSSSGIPAGTYSIEIWAPNYQTKALSGIVLAPGFPNQLNVSLMPYAPEVTSAKASPSEMVNDGQGTTLLEVRVSHLLGLSSIASVTGDLSEIGGSAQQVFRDDGKQGDAAARDGTYTYLSSVASGTKAKLYALNVIAFDQEEDKGFGAISLNVTEKVAGVVQPEESDSMTFENDLAGQTLNIHFEIPRAVSSLRAIMAACQIQLIIHGPDGSQYGPYDVVDSIDVSIPNAGAGTWEYVTTNPCASAVSYEIATSGGGTGMLAGQVVDALTGGGVEGASILCNTGGFTVSLTRGYFTGVAVAGTGVVTTAQTGYHTNIKAGIHIKAGSTTHVKIQVVPEGASAQASPSGANVYHILDPAEDPKPSLQPFAAKVSGGNIELNAVFPRYQQAVDIYLGLTVNDAAHAGKLFLINENNSVVELTDTLHPWRKACTQEDSVQVLRSISSAFPLGSYTLYSLVTTDAATLSNYDLSFFTTTLAQPAPAGQNVSMVSSPAEMPVPVTQPLAAKVVDGNLVLNALFPIQAQPVSIFLAYTTPDGALYLIKNDNSTELFSGTLSPWRQGVTAEQKLENLTLPTSQVSPGMYYFYSLLTTDPVGLSNFDLIWFSRDIVD